jgi:hypothetical protein
MGWDDREGGREEEEGNWDWTGLDWLKEEWIVLSAGKCWPPSGKKII